MTDFTNLDRAVRWHSRVADAALTAAARAGLSAWNSAPEYEQARARAARLLDAAETRRDSQVAALVSTGVPERTARSRAGLLSPGRTHTRVPRTQRPARRASR